MYQYTVVLTPDPAEGGFTVTVPALPGCFTQGGTEEDALANARDAIQVHVEGLRLDGEPVPHDDVVPKLVVVSVA